MVVETALGDLDVLIRFADYNYHVAVSAVVIADQVAGADLIPAWVVHPPPREVSKRRVRTQRSPAGAVGAPAVGPAAGGAGKQPSPPTASAAITMSASGTSAKRWTSA